MPTDMKLPELGENIEGGDVLRVMVKAGDAIKKDQAVLELETDKATIEVPSSVAGVVKDVKIKPGEKVKVGQTIFVIEEGADGGQSAEGGGQKAERRAERAKELETENKEQEPEVKPEEPKAEAKAEQPKPETPKRKADVVEMKPSKQAAASRAEAGRAGEGGRRCIDSRRAVGAQARARARREHPGHSRLGPGGRISMDDVTAYARRLLSGAGAGPFAGGCCGRRCPTSASGERSSASR